jgi:succinoglycan biosynthesis protein ExoM
LRFCNTPGKNKEQCIAMKPHITVCIATYKRTEFLKKLLHSLREQKTEGRFSYSLVVVDNDAGGSAKAVVAGFKKASLIKVEYHIQPVKNISLTRNMCVSKSRGDYIAFIDDDEYACGEWLYELYSTMREYETDVVHGYVEADFLHPVTRLRSSIFYFSRYNTFGKPVIKQGEKNYPVKSTNNCLIKSSLIKKYMRPFNPEYGLTGGEDTDFFINIAESGASFRWAAKAVVYEQIPCERCRLLTIIKRIMRAGNSTIRTGLNQSAGYKKQLIYLILLLKLVCWASCFFVFSCIGIFSIRYFIYYAHKLLFYAGGLSNLFSVKIYEYK